MRNTLVAVDSWIEAATFFITSIEKARRACARRVKKEE
ncbi:MAG: hypothetical protein K0S28_358 [Paucimonas sp.]|jgi:hypothetical protein|nr:hypothetical protein [Paucimonas sp.]